MSPLTEEEKKEGIVVTGPPEPVIQPEKKEKKDAKKALEEERFGVLQISDTAGTYFSTSLLAAGMLLLSVFTYFILTGFMGWIVISPDMPFSGLVLWVFFGIVNVFGGLLLMGCK